MGFMKSYKCLDNLCRDMNGVGVTGYIEDVEKKSKVLIMFPDGNTIITSSSIIGMSEIKLCMKIMRMKMICVPTGMKLGLTTFISVL